MSPEERQLLQGLFDRMQSQANNPRDREAEQLITDNLRQQPYAPYLLSQTVIVQDQALQAANQRLQQLEQQVQELQRNPPAQQGGGSFLSGLFGGGAASQPAQAQRPVWNQGGAPQGGGWGGGQAPQQGYAPPQQGGPWGGAPAQPSGGGGFLQGALGAAAGVAGGVLLADSVRGLFGGHNNSLGIASGVPGMGGGETVVNNYYGDQSGADARQDAAQDSGDYSGGGGTNADWQQDADQDQDAAQDAGDYSDDA